MKKVLIGLLVLIAVVFLAALIAPKDFLVEREIIIAKPKDVVFAKVKSLQTHGEWSPWDKLDPQMIKTFKGTDGTVGFVAAWTGNKDVGVGEQEIKNIVEGERVDFELRFKEPMEDTSAAYIITETIDANQTKVKWGMVGRNKIPFNLVCLAMNMKAVLGGDFEKGLTSLKALLEKQ